jgi:cell division ATPase FtsA
MMVLPMNKKASQREFSQLVRVCAVRKQSGTQYIKQRSLFDTAISLKIQEKKSSKKNNKSLNYWKYMAKQEKVKNTLS